MGYAPKGVVEMAGAVVRCPYCVSGGEFRPMIALADGAFVCGMCSHMAIPDDESFKCHCSKCVEMRRHELSRCG